MARGEVIVNLADSASVYKALYSNTPIEPEFKLTPRFAIVGADGKFVFSMGATMKFVMSYDWGNPLKNPTGMGISSLTKAEHGDYTLFQMSAGGSKIYFNIIGFPSTANQIGLFISINLDNESNNTYKLSAGQVYMRYRDFQVGYSTSLYNDIDADAFTIDSYGPIASGAHSTIGVNWQHYLNKHFRLGVGVEIPRTSFTQYNGPTGNDGLLVGSSSISSSDLSFQSFPDIPLYLGYRWKNGHVRLSSVCRAIHYVNQVTDESHNVFGGGLKLTSKMTFGPVSLFLMAQGGKAIANYFKDNSNAGLDLVPADNFSGELVRTRSWGCIGAVQYNITPKIFLTGQASYMRNYIPKYSNGVVNYEEQMQNGLSANGNVIWKISSLFSTGLEYRYGKRTATDGSSVSNNRVYAMFMMTF